MQKRSSTRTLGGSEDGFATTRLEALLGWARKYSLMAYPFVTACCGMEFFSVWAGRYDIARFGAEAPRFSPRQSDLLWVVGTISQRQAPVLTRIYEQMMEPKWSTRTRGREATGGPSATRAATNARYNAMSGAHGVVDRASLIVRGGDDERRTSFRGRGSRTVRSR